MLFEWSASLSISLAEYLIVQLGYCSLLFLIVYPAARWARVSFPAITMCFCWLVIIRLLVPVGIIEPWAVFNVSALMQYPAVSDWVPLVEYNEETIKNNAEGSFGLGSIILIFLFITYGFISAFKIFFLCRCRSHLYKMARAAKNVDVSLLSLVDQWKLELTIRRNVRCVISDRARFVYTIGSKQPYIVLPENIVKNNSISEIENIVAHELGHIKRFDDLIIIGLSILRCLFFFFPPLVICIAQMGQCREKLCDREILSRRKLNTFEYAKSLVKVANQLSPLNLGYYAVAQLTGASALSERITYFKNKNSMRKTHPLHFFAVVTLLSLIILPVTSHSRIGRGNSVLVGSVLVNSVLENTALEDSAMKSTVMEGLVMPIKEARVSSNFGIRIMPVGPNKGKKNRHRGVDFAATTGTPIYAASSGVVIEAVDDYKSSVSPGYGKYLIIQHDNGLQSRYLHLNALAVETGVRVNSGQKIGFVGSTGLASGPHLHFEVLRDNKYIDPADYFESGYGL